jgi:hypothetical protein
VVAILGALDVSTPRIFLSHTTRDERDRELAHRLAAGLEARGAQVWIAPESIPPGDAWKEGIVAGVMDGCTHFLVILSASSADAEWVIREIALARERLARDDAFRILPLRVGRELPRFDGRDEIDALQDIAYHASFDAQLDAVAAALGLTPPVPDSIREFVDEKAKDFVGREYVYEAIDAFIASHASGYFVIEGDPGAGKSAILARFVQLRGSIAHFNSRALGIVTPAQFIESVAAQIIARFGLPYASLPATATRDGTFLSSLLREAAAASDGTPIVIVIDALDEVDLAGAAGNVLFLPPVLPAGVFVLASRRQVRLPMTVDAALEVLDLGGWAAEGKRDVETFVRARIDASAALREWVDAHGLAPDAFASTVAEKSGGNFMYVRYVLPDIERGRYEDLRIDNLPQGLEAYYEDHWRRMGMTAKPLPRVKIRVVYVLSVALAPISRAFITRIAGDVALAIDEIAVQEVLDEWDPFLHEQRGDGQNRYSIYHASFRDFLHRRDVVQAAGITLEKIHELFADPMWDQLFGTGIAGA